LSTRQGGFTLTELVVTVAIMLIVILALGTVIADSIRGWHKMYARVYADVVTDGYVARNAFDRVVRSAGRQTYRLAADGAWLEVYYYSGPSAITLDRYACFKVLNGELQIEHGDWKPGTVTPRSNPTTETVCGNVSSCIFGRDANGDGYGDDYSPQMKLTLNDGTLTRTVVSSAVMHNGS
jgi:prepilin-type N-terminal cleavage/methylation domain-containing protein